MVRRHNTHRRARHLTITGRQFDDGTVLRGVTVDLGGTQLLDGDEARSLAAALLEAADELGRC